MAERTPGWATRRFGCVRVARPGRMRIAVLLATIGLAGCGANMRAALSTAGQALDGGQSTVAPAVVLDPRFEYLRVQIGRQAGRMVRADPGGAPVGRLSTWYSADGAVLRLDDGRLIGFSDGQRSWQAHAPGDRIDWAGVSAGRLHRYQRTVDQQPGYRIGQRESRQVIAMALPPAEHRYTGGEGPVEWFVDQEAEGQGVVVWYAVSMAGPTPSVRYGQACLWAEACLSWQLWPPKTRP